MLSEDGELGLSRGALDGAPSLLVVAPVSAQPSAKSLTHLGHAYALRDELDREELAVCYSLFAEAYHFGCKLSKRA
jgi:hypothetical protein